MRSRRQPSTSHQRFVGPELASVLEQVQAAHGSAAHIVSVDRVRQGGVAGFFARVHFEVRVDPPAEVLPALAQPGPGGGTIDPPAALSFADLLARRLEAGDLDDDDDLDRAELRRAAFAPSLRPAAERADDGRPHYGDDDLADLAELSPLDDGAELDLTELDRDDSPLAADGHLDLDDLDLVGLDDDHIDGDPDDFDDLDDLPFDDDVAPDDAGHQAHDQPVAVVPRPRLGSVDDWSLAPGGRRLLPGRPPDNCGPDWPVDRRLGGLTFWAGFDRARAEAELLDIPPVATTAIVGPLAAVAPIVAGHQARHWAGGCDVFAIGGQAGAEAAPWTVVDHPDDLVAVVSEGRSDFPLLVIDVPVLLPAWLRPLLDRLRTAGVGLVRYVLDGDPSDEDLATWHGEIGRPAVLDLVSTPSPRRVLELIDRGEPIASIGGFPLSAQLLLALRTEVSCAP